MLVFDIETDGLLDTVSKIHCINLVDTETGAEERYTDSVFYALPDGSMSLDPCPRAGGIEEGIERLVGSSVIGGHNVIGYDIPAILKVTGVNLFREVDQVRDSLIECQTIWSDVKDRDFSRVRAGKLDESFIKQGLAGSHSLRAWGIRFGEALKDDFKPSDFGHTWATVPFLKEMDDYCMADVRANAVVFERIDAKNYSRTCLDMENYFAHVIRRQERHGWRFDVKRAEALTEKLQARLAELDDECRKVFAPWFVPKRRFVPKRSNRRQGYIEGAPLTKIELTVFNPSSRDHIANRLTKLYGWQPEEFTPSGKPKIDETVLSKLPYPEARVLAEHFLVTKRLGQVADGKQAWLKKVDPDGRIRGRVQTNGAVTGRCTHSNPNVAQTPAGRAPYGKECRQCWTVEEGYKLVGCDAEGLELRELGHYMTPLDGGAYADTVVNGRKEDKSDVHNVNKRALGLNLRDSAKTWIYAFLYGAGDHKLGTVVYADMADEQKEKFDAKHPRGEGRKRAVVRLGRRSRDRVARNLPALAKLQKDVKAVAQRGWLRGHDGRRIPVRHAHAALNTLLQGGGACVMKKAAELADKEFLARGWRNSEDGPNHDYEFVGNIHDEFQIEAREEIAHDVGRIAADAIRRAGEFFGNRCELAGDFAVGDSWLDTH